MERANLSIVWKRDGIVLIWIAVFVLLLGGLPLWYAICWAHGGLNARWDLAHGRTRVLVYGLPFPWQEDYQRRVEKASGIEFHVLGEGIVSERLVRYVNGYNAVCMAAANRRYGRDIFAEARQAAEEAWNQAQPPSRVSVEFHEQADARRSGKRR